jgi:hypothetical protein
MIGHSSLVSSVDAHSSGLIASGSEDCSLKIGKGDIFCISKYIGFSHVELVPIFSEQLVNLTKLGYAPFLQTVLSKEL